MNEEPRIDNDEQENASSPEDQGQTEESTEGISDQGDIIINS